MKAVNGVGNTVFVFHSSKMVTRGAKEPDVGSDVVKIVSSNDADTVDTAQDRSSTNCDTPLITRLDNKSLAFMCNEQASDQMSMATQRGFDKHKLMQSATDNNG